MFSNAYCEKCGSVHPVKEMQLREDWEESGRSGDSITFRGWGSSSSSKTSSKGYNRRGGGASYNTGRTYYKKIKYYVCRDCLRQERAEAAYRAELYKKFAIVFFITWGGLELYKYLESFVKQLF